LDKDGNAYRNSPVVEDELLSEGTDSWRRILPGWREVYYPAFARLTEALRAGTNTALAAFPGTEPTLYQRIAHDPEKERVFHAAMSAFSERSVEALVQREEFANVRHVLDVGGGDGMTARYLADRYPGLCVTIFDLPSVTAIARGVTDTGGRITLHPGELFADDFPAGMDAVLFSHVLEVFAERVSARCWPRRSPHYRLAGRSSSTTTTFPMTSAGDCTPRGFRCISPPWPLAREWPTRSLTTSGGCGRSAVAR
ncbi:MAG: hypothetical protein JO287_06450, partial [Pseudonocardiales bacterium]|nr:hypothetical protein [Pseudonocardiales bacterium]